MLQSMTSSDITFTKYILYALGHLTKHTADLNILSKSPKKIYTNTGKHMFGLLHNNIRYYFYLQQVGRALWTLKLMTEQA